MHFIGDVHGKVVPYGRLIESLPESIQVGDMGFGFVEFPKKWSKKHRFIRGNHDSPERCEEHPNYLGNYGTHPTHPNIFFISGAYSIDYMYRTPEYSWWADEELPEMIYNMMYLDYAHAKPEIVVAHTCPRQIGMMILGIHAQDKMRFPNRTEDVLLPSLLEIHQPRLWVFGHFHTSFQTTVGKTKFVCLNELEVFNEAPKSNKSKVVKGS
jgi:hypothetical protein